jgi:hypothetical protein
MGHMMMLGVRVIGSITKVECWKHYGQFRNSVHQTQWFLYGPLYLSSTLKECCYRMQMRYTCQEYGASARGG